ncbi:MAG: galactose mutarotase, partial [Rhizobiales bacterium]|nr:galactose mutarotase [Hyphomicrobiales bacterium]
SNGMSVSVLNLGGIISAINVADRQGLVENIVLGYDNLEQYWMDDYKMGAIVGPYANRISNARFRIAEQTYLLEKNYKNKHHIHSGVAGFDKKVWQVKTNIHGDYADIILSHIKPCGEAGFPGELSVTVTYRLDNENKLSIFYDAETTQATPLNLTHHSYFNLNTNTSSDILDHSIMIDADRYVLIDDEQMPTGELGAVMGSVFDFTKVKLVGVDIDKPDPQLSNGGGYDHCWVFNETDLARVKATVYASENGRKISVYTDRPAVQFYTGNSLSQKNAGLCLETQGYVDAVNQANFPNDILEPNKPFRSTTIYVFSCE